MENTAAGRCASDQPTASALVLREEDYLIEQSSIYRIDIAHLFSSVNPQKSQRPTLAKLPSPLRKQKRVSSVQKQ